MKRKIPLKSITAYIILPLAFFVTTYLFIYCALKPFIGITLDVWSMFSSDTNLDGADDYDDIFTHSSLLGYDGTVKASDITYPTFGTKYGEIEIVANNTLNTIPLIYGDSNAVFKRGAGQYIGSGFPGEGSTILVSAHNNTYFNCLKNVEVGEFIEVKTSYGKYKYEITDIAIKHESDLSAFDLTADKETLVLYTCYPFDLVGYKENRIYVTAILVSGPKVDKYN